MDIGRLIEIIFLRQVHSLFFLDAVFAAQKLTAAFAKVFTAVVFTAAVFHPACASDWDEGSNSKQEAKVSKNASVRPDQKLILHGQVQHADSLPALSDELQAGSGFNSKALPQPKYASSWFKIPSWFAGSFESTQTTIDYIKDYASGKSGNPGKTVASHGQEVHGYQRDTKGDIWHYYVKSGSSMSEQARHVTFNTIDWYGPEYVGEDRVVIRVLASSFVVDKASKIIVDSYRREDIKTYEPLSNGLLKVSYTSKSFDSRGKARDLQNGRSIHRMTAAFQSIDRDKDLNYKELFDDYLSAENLSHLIQK